MVIEPLYYNLVLFLFLWRVSSTGRGKLNIWDGKMTSEWKLTTLLSGNEIVGQ
jgi:hypothetical protein